MSDPVRLVHFSDIHVTAPGCAWRMEDWFNKRLYAWINLRLMGRGFRFRHTEAVLNALVRDVHSRRPDHLVFSGDATAMGFEAELARAAELLRVQQPDMPPGLAVPGNHDYCTASARASGHFERTFAAWQQGERVRGEVYPFAQRVGPVWLVAVNSSTANRWAWDARGGVGQDQLERLETLLGRLEGGPRILVTHYPVWMANGKPERRIRALRDLDDLVAVAERGGISLWLHGHRHDNYHHHPLDFVPFPVICAGSATQNKHWSYSEYKLHGYHLEGLHRTYEPRERRFHDCEAFTLDLPGRGPEAGVRGQGSRSRGQGAGGGG